MEPEPENVTRSIGTVTARDGSVTVRTTKWADGTYTVAAAVDPSVCPVCGEWRDAPDADCANCAYPGHDDHRSSEEADKGGAMETICVDCGSAIARDSYGSFVGPWVLATSRATGGERHG